MSYFGGGGHARGTYKPGAAAAGLSVNVHRSSLYLVSSVAGGFATCFFKADSVVDWMVCLGSRYDHCSHHKAVFQSACLLLWVLGRALASEL